MVNVGRTGCDLHEPRFRVNAAPAGAGASPGIATRKGSIHA